MRPVIMLSVDLYTTKREREFEAVEAQLPAVLARKGPRMKRTVRRAHNAAR